MPSNPPISRAEQRTNTLRRIVNAAREVLETQGPKGFSARAIATRAGISQGRLLQYYKSLDDVAFEAYSEWVQDEFAIRAAHARAAATPEAQLTALFEIGFARDQGGAQVMRQVSRYAWFWPKETEDRFRAHSGEVVSLVADIVRPLAPKAKDKALLDAAQAIVAVYVTVLRRATVEGWTPSRSASRAMDLCATILAGLRTLG